MDKKICNKCKNEKELDEFGNNKSKKDGKQLTCKICVSEQQLKCYHKDKTKYFQRNKKVKTKIKDEFITFKKTLSCSKCNDNRYYVLDFHHLEKTLKFDWIHKILFNYGGINSNKFKEEIEKCVVLCSNCHREFHHLERENQLNIHTYLNT